MFSKITTSLLGVASAHFTVSLDKQKKTNNYYGEDTNEYGPLYVGSQNSLLTAIYDTAVNLETVMPSNVSSYDIKHHQYPVSSYSVD